MNYVIAIIQPQKLDAVREALVKLGVLSLTVSDVQGYGRQEGLNWIHAAMNTFVNFVRKVKLEVALPRRIWNALVKPFQARPEPAAGKVGDGKIFVLELKDAVRIRTGEAWQHGALKKSPRGNFWRLKTCSVQTTRLRLCASCAHS